MTVAIQFHTFDEMAAVLSENTPHALVQDWWSRLEAVIRGPRFCAPGLDGCVGSCVEG